MFAHLTQVMSAVEKAAGGVYKSGSPKPESHVESGTSIFTLHPTMPKKALDSRPYTVDTGTLHRQPLSGGERGAAPNKPEELNVRYVNKIQGFQAKQTQRRYLTCYQWDTVKIKPFFDETKCRHDQGSKIKAHPSRT